MPNFQKLRDHVNNLASLLIAPEPGLHTWCLFVGQEWKAIAEMWKDQPLESAAPEMLDALKECVGRIEDDGIGNSQREIYYRALAAIAKAEGRS
jgi:hypothetical protein